MDNAEFKRDVEKLIAETPQRPGEPLEGRGIVTTAGGNEYFVNAYVNVNLLRHHGCTLPVEWFHLGSAEMTPEMIEIAESIPDVRCIDLSEDIEMGKSARKSAGGWQSKPLSILRSSFEEVMFLDADSFPRRDPTFLFDVPAYTEHGALFWPDIHDWSKERFKVLSQVFDVPFRAGPEFETGQIVVQKSRCWRALVLTHLYNQWSDLVYKVVYGDKDTFYFAFRRTDTPFNVIGTAAGFGKGCLLQHDPQGEALFCHCVGAKWSLSGRTLVTKESLPERNICRKFVKELRRRWSHFRVGKANLSRRRHRKARRLQMAMV